MIKLSTINQIVEAILSKAESCSPGKCETIANEAVIYYKTAMICEAEGIKAAMKYFTGTHNTEEYQEFRTGMVMSPVSLCTNCQCMTHTIDGRCAKCWAKKEGLKEVKDEQSN